MKSIHLTILTLLLTTILGTNASAQRVFRSEFIPYSMRVDSDTETRSDSTRYVEFRPTISRVVDEPTPHIAVTQLFALPYEWSDGRTFMHIENIGSSYSLAVNGKIVDNNSDPLTPAEYNLTRHLNQGLNILTIMISGEESLDEGVERAERPKRSRFDNCYLYAQYRRDIHDFEAKIVPDTSGRFGILKIAALVENGFNYERRVDIGFDIYDRNNRLLDYSMLPVNIAGNTRDTVRFETHIYNSDSCRWSPDSPTLYRVTLTTKSDGVIRSYIPRKVAYAVREYDNGDLYNFGVKQTLRSTRYNATRSRDESIEDLIQLKEEGYNTLCPDYPQPEWFYNLCDEMGFYLIEQANINTPQEADNRAVGGTPSNNPELTEEYLTRVKASYTRSQHHPSIIAFSLGSDSGNGHNMYRAYELLKELESERPILYKGVNGEWNSDKLIIE